MSRPTTIQVIPVTCTQLVTRFDRNGERPIGLELLRGVRTHMSKDMRAAGARGSMVWRLARTPSGITMTAIWHARRERMIDLARPPRASRQERRRRAAAEGIQNRRRVGARTVPHTPSVATTQTIAAA